MAKRGKELQKINRCGTVSHTEKESARITRRAPRPLGSNPEIFNCQRSVALPCFRADVRLRKTFRPVCGYIIPVVSQNRCFTKGLKMWISPRARSPLSNGYAIRGKAEKSAFPLIFIRCYPRGAE